MDTQEFLGSPGSPIVIGAILTQFMRLIRISPIPNWYIPFITVAVGIVAQCFASGLTYESVGMGFLAGCAAVWMNQAVWQVKTRGPDGISGTGDTDFIEKQHAGKQPKHKQKEQP